MTSPVGNLRENHGPAMLDEIEAPPEDLQEPLRVLAVIAMPSLEFDSQFQCPDSAVELRKMFHRQTKRFSPSSAVNVASCRHDCNGAGSVRIVIVCPDPAPAQFQCRCSY